MSGKRYRVFVPERDELPEGVTAIERYPAFAIVSATQETIDGLQGRYPVEPLKEPSPPPSVPNVADLAARVTEKRSRGPYVVVVRFRAPVRQSWVDALEATGAASHGALGNTTVVVSCPNKPTLDAVGRLPEVESVSPYVPTIRLSEASFLERSPSADADAIEEAAGRLAKQPARVRSGYDSPLPGILVADFFTEAYKRRAQRSLKRANVRDVTDAGITALGVNLRASDDPLAAIGLLAAAPGLRTLEEKQLKKLFNDVARRVVGARVLTTNPGLGLTGAGEIVAVADSGLDTGDSATVHADFRGRVRDIQSFPINPIFSSLLENPGADDGAADRNSGHGTHVSGSVLGNGARAEALGVPQSIQGTAPEAELVFQAVEQTTQWNTQGQLFWLSRGEQPPPHGLFGIPGDMADLLQPAYDQGARVHSNSWGGGAPGAYDEQCRQLDRFVWDNQDLLVVVAAGNSGQDVSPQGGGIDPGSVDSPGTAKNCLTVGASENDRPGQFPPAYGDWWADDYPIEPFSADNMVDTPDDIVAFSSRGPCNTGRRKPDVLAPGTFVLSTRSSQIASNNFAWAAFPPAKQDYMYMGGTSMATPLVSGCAAVIRQYLRDTLGITEPSAALLKAAVIHSARYIPYRHAHPSSAPFADNEQGWGRVDLQQVIAPAAPANVLFIDETDGLATGDEITLGVNVGDDAVAFRATLVYTDFPGEDLVNNLNLFAGDPNGGIHIGNDHAGTGTVDALNNVEGIVVERPATGAWTIRIVASDVPMGPQRFGLVISGGEIKRTD